MEPADEQRDAADEPDEELGEVAAAMEPAEIGRTTSAMEPADEQRDDSALEGAGRGNSCRRNGAAGEQRDDGLLGQHRATAHAAAMEPAEDRRG
jgi:hypothetical protein